MGVQHLARNLELDKKACLVVRKACFLGHTEDMSSSSPRRHGLRFDRKYVFPFCKKTALILENARSCSRGGGMCSRAGGRHVFLLDRKAILMSVDS